jgi:hypothetical protein
LPEIKTIQPIDKTVPYYWQPIKDNMLLCHNCRISKHCHKDKERWTGWKISAKTIKAFNTTLNLTEGCNIARASLLKDVANAQRINKTPSVKLAQLPLFIEQLRVGSHREWVETSPKHGYHRIVEDYESVYHNCLASKEWLKEHEHFEYPEPTIEITINDKTLPVNGNYKKGLIAGFMENYTEKVKAGKKTLTVVKGGHVENRGGGCYVAINGELVNGEYKYF